ncbi:Spo0B C-terminal domain-containing protein [Neobacillus cucumis]|uniref:Spo0B C-terminal domain-containing protein n=1 Tax=Neobacillus cucumis TaxID=1740721 RepID=UPI0028536846|nr:Spo0B C-terminal domain-containing protein [Neobacillus cucumis]MDR4948733.1 Spo0B C-terminal domain-containing protein [Neobacillus cucumis]
MGNEWDIVEVLRHSRHDWLNKLQLIKGNLDLNRIDRVKQVIDEIVIEAQHEAKLSNLHIPLFAALLLKSNWENPSFKLEYEVLLEPDASNINDMAVTNWTNTFFGSLKQAIEPYHENNLSITIEPQTNGVRFFFDFSGIIRNRELIEGFLSDKTVEVSVMEFTETELSLELFMPFEK